MRSGWKIAFALLVALAALVAVNAIVVQRQTASAELTAPGARILDLPAGAVQVVDEGPTEVPPARAGPAIVLVHCYACSLHWWDRIAPLLAERHRVVRLDLLGHGGSEKPPSGYSIPDQAAVLAATLNRLEVEGATVVGHSMGFTVTVALSEQASQLVDRMVGIGEGPAPGFCSLPFTARLSSAPVIGPALWRTAPNFAVEDGYGSAFAPDFEPDTGFARPGQVVSDYRAMTFTSFSEARAANRDYRDEAALDERARATAVPMMSIFGDEDRICDPITSQAAFEAVPGARVRTIAGAGHSPNVERPEETAELIEAFARAGAGSGGG